MLGTQLIDQARGLVIAGSAAIGFDQSVNVLAQSMPALNDTLLMQIAEKGGGWAVLLVVLFFYRRDFLRKESNDNTTNEKLFQAMSKQAESEQKLAVALAENTEVMRRVIALDEGRR